jgi:cytosine/adenosine deaminase-related metal-dependent hydrolase
MHSVTTAATALGLFTGLATASSKLLHGGTIVAFDSASESLRVVRDGSLLITDDRIAGIYDDVPSSLPNGTERVDVTGQIVTPGFIDTHRHGWQTAFKTIGSNTTLTEYFNRYGEYASAAAYTAEDVYVGQLAGLYEALNAGVTTTLDHAHHTWDEDTSLAGAQASVDSGARVVWSYAFHDTGSNFTWARQIANFRDIAESGLFDESPSEIGIAHDTWTQAPDEVNREIFGLVDDYNVSAMTMHLVSGPFGYDNLPTALHREWNMLNTSLPVVFSHASFIPATDVQLLRQTNQFISITPESEMHYGHTHEESFRSMDQAALGVDTHFTFSVSP